MYKELYFNQNYCCDKFYETFHYSLPNEVKTTNQFKKQKHFDVVYYIFNDSMIKIEEQIHE